MLLKFGTTIRYAQYLPNMYKQTCNHLHAFYSAKRNAVIFFFKDLQLTSYYTAHIRNLLSTRSCLLSHTQLLSLDKPQPIKCTHLIS